MLNPGTILFLCVVVAGCGGSLRELKAQLRAKRARALGLQEDCEGSQCGFCYPEDPENPRNWGRHQQQYPQVSLPLILRGVQQGYPGPDASNQRFPGMEPGQSCPGQDPTNQQHPGHNFPGQDPTNQQYPGQSYPGHDPTNQQYPGQSPMSQQYPGHHQSNFPSIQDMVQKFPGHSQDGQNFPGHSAISKNFPGMSSSRQNFPGQSPTSQNLPQHNPTVNLPGLGPPHQNLPDAQRQFVQDGLPPGVNAPYCFTEDGQPRFPGMAPPPEFVRRWRSPLPVTPEAHMQENSMVAANQTPYPGARDPSYQQVPELPGEKLRKKLDALLHPAKQPGPKYPVHLSPNFHHPQAHHSPKFGDGVPAKMNVLRPPKMGFLGYGDAIQPGGETEKPSDLPSEWMQPSYSKKKQSGYEKPSTTTTPKPLSSFFKDFLPKYVETVPPPTCPVSKAFQEAEGQEPGYDQEQQPELRQQTSPYEQPPPSSYKQPPPSSYEQPSDRQASQEHHPSPHQFDPSSGSPYGHRSHLIPKPYQQK